MGNCSEVTLYNADSLDVVRQVADGTVNVIMSDGAYGLDKFVGDTRSAGELPAWYDPHLRLWSRVSAPACTLWLWNTEVGWATLHPTLLQYGWRYRALNVWNKGLAHVAGRSNTRTLTSFPVVTEVCAQYVRASPLPDQSLQHWVCSEWTRTGLPLRLANEACGVRNAASRKYLTRDHRWYAPPVEALLRMARYANENGCAKGAPYFAVRGRQLDAQVAATLYVKFRCPAGVTNVWTRAALRDVERHKREDGATGHINQKPLDLVRQLVEASSDHGDLVLDPFLGTGTTAVACKQTRRRCIGVERNEAFFAVAQRRLQEAA